MTRGNSPSRRSVYPVGQPAPEPGDVLISRTGGPDGAHALRVVPNPRVDRFQKVESLGWVLPIDDTHYRIYAAGRVTEQGALQKIRSRQGGKRWEELTPAEHREFPGDYEAQTGQGEITFHSEEHLATSDKGIAFLRRFMEKQLSLVAAGGDPAGVRDEYVRFDAGNYLIEKK